MAENNVTTTGTVVWQDGDDLSEQNLTQRAAKTNQTDYVERGLGITADWAAGTIDIGSGYAVIQDGQQAYDVFPDAETDVSLPNESGSNYVYLTHDPATDDSVSIHVDDDDTPPSTPSLKRAVVDTSAESVTPLNSAPDGEFGDFSADTLTSPLDGGEQTVTNLGGVSTTLSDKTLSSLGSLEDFIAITTNLGANYMTTGYVSVTAEDGTDRTAALYRFIGTPGAPVHTELVEQGASAGGGGLTLNIDYSAPDYTIQVQADSGSGWSNPPEVFCSTLVFGRDLEVTIVS